jgi:hypothetical protein
MTEDYLILNPPDGIAMFVFAHGAGAGMRHRWMGAVAARMAERGIGSVRYEFPFMAAGKGSPDHPPAAHRAVRAAVEVARDAAPTLPLFAGGKSYGGRMTTQAEAERAMGLAGLACFGFPLHPPGKHGIERAAHLADVRVPMLFLQGDYDPLCDLDLMREALKDRDQAELVIIEKSDHSLEHGRRDETGPAEAVDRMAVWVAKVIAARS